MELGDAVDRVAAHDAQMRHAHLLFVTFLDDRNLAQLLGVDEGKLLRFTQKLVVDAEDNLHVAGQNLLQQRHRPLLQRLGKQRVIGISQGVGCDLPGVLPRHVVLVQQDTH